MTPGVSIDAKEKIVLILSDLDSTIKITTLKSGLKYDFILIQSRVHTLKSPIVNFIFEESILPHRIL
jgi:hypothetical protein